MKLHIRIAPGRIKLLIVCVLLVVGGLSLVLNQTRAQGDNPFAEWRPNNETQGIRYVGNDACVECHVARGSQVNTPMAQAMEVAPDCRILNARSRLTFKNGEYKYEISRQGKDFIYSV